MLNTNGKVEKNKQSKVEWTIFPRSFGRPWTPPMFVNDKNSSEKLMQLLSRSETVKFKTKIVVGL
jgi:hypothetical protein